MIYDTIIVGAGASGAILAARLSEDSSRNVLLLEPGPDYPDFKTLPDDLKFGISGASTGADNPHDWDYRAIGTDSSEPIPVPRGRVMGGSTATNAQIFLRGAPEDYDSWAATGLDQWSYKKLLPAFRRSENDLDYSGDFHGKSGPISCVRAKPDELLPMQSAFYDACRATGISDCPDHNLPDSTGVGPLPFNNIDGVRISTALGYLSVVRHRLNLTIRAGALVHRVIIENNRAVGVMVESGEEIFKIRSKEVIVSAGAVVSPQLLMLSGIGPAEHLKEHGINVVADLPGVGQNLQDHPVTRMIWNTKPDYEFRSNIKRVQIGLRYTADGSDNRNDMIVYVSSFGTERPDRGGGRHIPIGVQLNVTLNMAYSRGNIRLASANIDDQPMIDFNYFDEPRDLTRMREGVRKMSSLVERPEFRDIVSNAAYPTRDIVGDDEALDDWIRRDVTTGHHISGSNKMGVDSDPMAVVGQLGKVRGVEGLRVIDASIMPTCVRANINATVIAMAERMAELITQ